MTTSRRPFVLASASPARLATLRRAGVTPDVVVSGVDEDAITADTTGELVLLLAAAKARAVLDRVGDDALVLGCDTLLDLDGDPLGKPATAEIARQRWRRMRGRTGTLYTGHHLIDGAADAAVSRTVVTAVHFADVSDAEIDAYCATGEPTTVAGAFTLDGLSGWFIAGVDGDHHNVVGVSLPTVRSMLRELGHGLDTIGYPADRPQRRT